MSISLQARALPVLETEPARRGPDRSADRRVTLAGLVVAIIFVALAVLSLALPAGARLGLWLPVHLALAGAAGTAIAAMLPFFVAALAVGRPVPAPVRVASLVLVAGGALLGVAGRLASGGDTSLVAAGGAGAFVAGMTLVGLSAALPLRAASGTRRVITEAAYAVAIVDVLVGVSIVALFLAGDADVVSAWSRLRAAHAWLNLLGFVTLVIAGTLVHFAPTVAGSRIRRRRAGATAVSLLAIAAPLVATGYAAGAAALAGVLASAGVVAALAGAAALALHGLHAHRDRAGWTTDLAWHRFTGTSLLLAPAWLLVATLVAAAGVLAHGTGPGSWRLDDLIGPLVLGFVLQVLLASVTHLVPAIGPGTPDAHARQRRLLGRVATWRLLGFNLGVGLFIAGHLASSSALGLIGGAMVLVSGVATLTLLGASLRR